MELLQYDFMQRALIASLLVGLTAPTVGVYLVQRRLALIGDGIGHVALTGVAVGVLTGVAPVWTALVASVAAAVLIELVRARGSASADVALAIVFYGGIAGGVVLIALAPEGSPANLNAYLFGAITTTSPHDLLVFGALAAVVLWVTVGLSGRLYAVSSDEEYARATGLDVTALNLLIAALTAATVVVSMRVVGLLLFSALMIVPVAISQQIAWSFRSTMVIGVAVGVVVSVAGTSTSFYAGTPSGGTIVLIAIGLFALVVIGSGITAPLRAARARAAGAGSPDRRAAAGHRVMTVQGPEFHGEDHIDPDAHGRGDRCGPADVHHDPSEPAPVQVSDGPTDREPA